MHDRKSEVVIIGAGPGGLAAAILLAKAGLRVTVLEKQDRVGGRTATLTAQGFRFDIGPTFFLYPRILQEIYASAGFDLRSEVPMIRLDPQYRLVFGAGGELLATPDVERMKEGIAKLCPNDAASFVPFMEHNREKLERFRPCLESPFLGMRDMMSTKLLGLIPLLRPWCSLDNELKGFFSDERIRLGFSFQSKYLGMSPFRCPSLFSILAFLEYEAGVWHPVGGCGAVSQNMAKVARQMGVDVRLNEPVTEMLMEGRRALGVRTAQGTYRADATVVNADFARTMTKLVPDSVRRRWTNKKLAQKKFSCSTFMLYLGIEGRYDNVQHHSIYVAKDYNRNLEEIEIHHTLSDDPSFYVQNACVTDPSLAPPGMSTLYVLVPVTHRHPNVNWSFEKLRYRQLALEQLRKIGITDLDRRIRFEHMVTPDDWEEDYEIHLGATFNLSHTLKQMLHLRPRNRFEDVEAMYLVGGGTHPGSGLPVIYESARITSRLVLQDFGISAPSAEQALTTVSSGVA